MADIFVENPHGVTTEEALAYTTASMNRMAEKMGLEVDWKGNKATMKGTGVKDAWIEVDDTNVTISITLGLMAKPMKGFIENKIREKFERGAEAARNRS